MNTTINISMPKKMYEDVKSSVKVMRYSSVSELVRAALRDKIYSERGYTVNGFTPEFEEMVLESEKEPVKGNVVLKSERDIRDHYNQIVDGIKKNKYN